MESRMGKHHSDMGTYQIIEPNSIVLCLFDMDVTPRIVGHSDKTGIITSAYTNIIPKNNVDSKYYYYYYLLQDYNNYLFSQGTGIRTTLTRSQFGALKIALPPKQEQTIIANFLDYKTEKINRFIKNKKQLIKLLNEQKEAIINKAVTKGVKPNIPIVASGVEWLGDIPANWEVKRMKYLGEAIIGLTYSPTEMVDKGEGTLVLRSSNVQNGKITYNDCVYVTTEIPDKKRTRKGDILICSRNGSIKLIGKNALIDEKASNESFGAFMTIFRSENYEYLHYFFNSSSFKAQSGLFSTSTINQLTTGILNNIIISIPKTLDEQLEVINFIKKETEVIDKTITTIEKEIALVEEYKTALIEEAVTGKIDVRGFKVPKEETPLAMVAEEAVNYKRVNKNE
jgi:type I restriction enzyme S subunit